MAVDTRGKRASCLGYAMPPRLVMPNPDGTIGTADRCQLAYIYCGLAVISNLFANYRASVVAYNYAGTVVSYTPTATVTE